MKYCRTKVITATIAMAMGSWVQASDNAVTIFPAEGNKQCSDYSSNSLVFQMATSSPTVAGTLSGPENARDADNTGESAAYTVAGGTLVGFSGATTPIDYAILKSGRDVALMIYPSGGVTSDANMQLLVNGAPRTITALSLCYGLGNQAPTPPPPPPPATIARCEDLNTGVGGLDELGITCPSNGARSIIYNLELDKPFYNTDGTPLACVCNSQALTECDPAVPAGEPMACPDPASPTKLPTEVTTHIELNNDPYVCSTVGGVRRCFSY